jgi:putative membrane protein
VKVKGLVLLIFVLLVLIIAGFIGSQNAQLVSINYLVNAADTQVRMSLVLAITFGLGFVVCFILMLAMNLRQKWRINSLERKLKKLTHITHSE